jgi:hypothetical protein
MNDENVKGRRAASGSEVTGDGADTEEVEETLRQRVEEGLAGFVPEVLKRTLEAGLGTISRSEKGVLKLPKEVVLYFLAQVDETKNAMLRVVAGEVRDFLQHTDLAGDMVKALTSMSLEVSTRVRFIPNESGTSARPEIENTVRATSVEDDGPSDEENAEPDP